MHQAVIEQLSSIDGNPFDKIVYQQAVSEFFELGFDASYSISYTPAEVARHVYGYLTAKAEVVAGSKFLYEFEGEKDAFYFCTAADGDQVQIMHQLEHFLEAKAPTFRKSHAISIRSYHSQGYQSNGTVILFTAEYVPFIDATGTGATFRDLTTEKFLRLRPADTRKRYEDILQKRLDQFVPVYTVNKLSGDDVLALKVAFIPDRICYLTALSSLIMRIPSAVIIKKFCETFSNGVQVYTFYTRHATVAQLQKAASEISMLPHVPGRVTTKLYNAGLLTADEVVYCNAITMFAFYFTPPRSSEDFGILLRELEHKPMNVNRLNNIRSELFREIMSESFIGSVVSRHVGLLHILFNDFVQGTTAESAAKIDVQIQHHLKNASKLEQQIFHTFVTFNRSVIKTNFFKVQKAAVAFRLDPSVFIPQLDLPRVPHGIFLVLGSQFRGFHVRFTEIARGGIRMIVSNSDHVYQKNKANLFAENYNLALAQLLKNKDIPEGGSKGTILVSMRAAYDRKTLFLQYVDALLDLIIPGVEGVRSSMKNEEILFLGPDENTAGAFPAIAALHSKSRGYAQWKSFTTGKDQILGGIPHDTFGMTSRGVRSYVECIYRKLNLKPETLTKFQTGGPDGDLGSNEILLGNENYIGLVDGSGSLYDPAGINKDELSRLAKGRLMLAHFDATKLSPKGFFVGIKEKNRNLPDTTLVEDGEAFRNTFHFSKYCIADTFVPCGGRPASINMENVHHMLVGMPDVKPQMMIEGKIGNLAGTEKLRFKYIVEGANLFITHDARLALETVGVILIKDSSANKGGVTCSSLEVLSGLSLSDAEHTELMCVKDAANPPPFYTKFVQEAMATIERNATREFECLWAEKLRGAHNGRMTTISDQLSLKIVDIRRFIAESDLYSDVHLKRYVLHHYFPQSLKEKVSLDVILDRVPQTYLKAIFAIWIASNFVYSTGLKANEFSFFMYMHELSKKAREMSGGNTGPNAKL
jgi:glutamate dehydrogenase